MTKSIGSPTRAREARLNPQFPSHPWCRWLLHTSIPIAMIMMSIPKLDYDKHIPTLQQRKPERNSSLKVISRREDSKRSHGAHETDKRYFLPMFLKILHRLLTVESFHLYSYSKLSNCTCVLDRRWCTWRPYVVGSWCNVFTCIHCTCTCWILGVIFGRTTSTENVHLG